MKHHPECDSVECGPDLGPSIKPCNCGAVDRRCASCGELGVETRMTEDRFRYGVGADAPWLSATVPVRSCPKCKFEWTDWEAEDIREAVVQEYKRSRT